MVISEQLQSGAAPSAAPDALPPEIVIEDNPEMAALSRETFRLALAHVARCEGAPQSPYMDEGFAPDRIWAWDTCFAALFSKYAPDLLPGAVSLDNVYAPFLDGAPTTLPVHIPDNPPLFAWAEREHCRHAGDRARLERVFFEKRWPQRMFDLYESFQVGDRLPCQGSPFPVMWERRPLGYTWSGGRSGMDNTPRGGFGPEVFDNDARYLSILWLDAVSQQALACRVIHEVTGEEIWRRRFDDFASLINERYWDEESGTYCDIGTSPPHAPVRVLTPASFWPLLAGVVPPDRARRLVAHLENPVELGGAVPFPSVSRSSPQFDPDGRYWRGGVWLPLAYVCVRALEENGFGDLADTLAQRVVRHQLATWLDFSPHTVWECYSPTAPRPATGKRPGAPGARPDFCGWSALGPINMAIENVVGIRCDGFRRRVEWRIRRRGVHGVRRLRFGGGVVSLVFASGAIDAESDIPFTLVAGGREFAVPAGRSRFVLDGASRTLRARPTPLLQVHDQDR